MQRAVDRGFWISWHDLPKETEGEHIAWLHGTYIPKILSRPGVLWAAHFKTVLTAPGTHMLRTKDPAVPNGSDYVLIFGGESTTAFTKGVDHFRNGGTSRLDRDLSGRFGTEAYAMEECTVELLSAMICADLSISVEPRPDHETVERAGQRPERF